MTRLVYIVSIILSTGLLVGCNAVSGQDQETITVFAASSLTDSFEEIGMAFETEHPNVEVVFNFAGSSQLAAQIIEGAPADVFASANQTQMSNVQTAGRIDGDVVIFASNQLIMITPSDNPANLQSPLDLGQLGLKLITAVEGVPIRSYTDQLVEYLATQPEYGIMFSMAFEANIVSEEANVRQIVAKIALGEADAAIVYTTDITPDVADDVALIPLPQIPLELPSYYIARIKGDPNPILSQQFVDFVTRGRGQAILRKWGFAPPDQQVTR